MSAVEAKKDARFAILDTFIASNQPCHAKNVHYFDISCRDLNDGKKLFERMINYQGPYYEIFGGCGYKSFGLYKSSENIIYLIVVDLQTPEHCMIINSASDFNY